MSELSLSTQGAILSLRAILDREVPRRTANEERNSELDEWAVAVALLVDAANTRALRLIRRAAGLELTDEEQRMLARDVGSIYEKLKLDIDALHRPHLTQLVDMAIRHAAGGTPRDALGGISGLEAGVMTAKRDSSRAIEQTGAALMVIAGDPGTMADAVLAEQLADSMARKGRNRLAAVVAVVGVGTYALAKLDTIARRRLTNVLFVHDAARGPNHPCVICDPFVDKVFPLDRVPLPPLHVRCDCDLAPVT